MGLGGAQSAVSPDGDDVMDDVEAIAGDENVDPNGLKRKAPEPPWSALRKAPRGPAASTTAAGAARAAGAAPAPAPPPHRAPTVTEADVVERLRERFVAGCENVDPDYFDGYSVEDRDAQTELVQQLVQVRPWFLHALQTQGGASDSIFHGEQRAREWTELLMRWREESGELWQDSLAHVLDAAGTFGAGPLVDAVVTVDVLKDDGARLRFRVKQLLPRDGPRAGDALDTEAGTRLPAALRSVRKFVRDACANAEGGACAMVLRSSNARNGLERALRCANQPRPTSWKLITIDDVVGAVLPQHAVPDDFKGLKKLLGVPKSPDELAETFGALVPWAGGDNAMRATLCAIEPTPQSGARPAAAPAGAAASAGDGEVAVVVYDLETTGLGAHRARIIEIAARRVDLSADPAASAAAGDPFAALVNPGVPIDDSAIRVHGITESMVAQAPSPADALKGFARWVEDVADEGRDVLIVAHNAKCFDAPLLSAELERSRVPPPCPRGAKLKVVDSLELAKAVIPHGDVRNFKLGTLREHFGGDLVGQEHRAGSDVEALCAVLRGLARAAPGGAPGLLTTMKSIAFDLPPAPAQRPSAAPRMRGWGGGGAPPQPPPAPSLVPMERTVRNTVAVERLQELLNDLRASAPSGSGAVSVESLSAEGGNPDGSTTVPTSALRSSSALSDGVACAQPALKASSSAADVNGGHGRLLDAIDTVLGVNVAGAGAEQAAEPDPGPRRRREMAKGNVSELVPRPGGGLDAVEPVDLAGTSSLLLLARFSRQGLVSERKGLGQVETAAEAALLAGVSANVVAGSSCAFFETASAFLNRLEGRVALLEHVDGLGRGSVLVCAAISRLGRVSGDVEALVRRLHGKDVRVLIAHTVPRPSFSLADEVADAAATSYGHYAYTGGHLNRRSSLNRLRSPELAGGSALVASFLTVGAMLSASNGLTLVARVSPSTDASAAASGPGHGNLSLHGQVAFAAAHGISFDKRTDKWACVDEDQEHTDVRRPPRRAGGDGVRVGRRGEADRMHRQGQQVESIAGSCVSASTSRTCTSRRNGARARPPLLLKHVQK